MNANKMAKKAIVKEILNKIKNSSAIVVAEYAGLSVKDIQELKLQLHEANVEMKIYKNRLFKIALQQTKLEKLTKELVGPNAFVFGTKDNIAPAKILTQFAKKHPVLKLKIGTFENKVIDANDLAKIAALPSIEEALTILAKSLLAPISQVGKGLFLISNKRLL